MGLKNMRAVLQGMALSLFLFAVMVSGGCGEDLKAANEKLKKDATELSAENDRLKLENSKLRNDLSALHSQVAELNMQISSLTDQNQAFRRDMDELKDRVKGRRK